MPDINVQTADWQHDQQALVDIRTRVFVDEQKVPANLEIDGMDPQCVHVKATIPSGVIIGTARLLPSNYIGRMCVLKPFRNHGAGRLMLSYLIEHAQRQNIRALMLNAQISAQPFYQRFGFKPDSEIFLEAGIKHVHMTYILAK